LAGSVVRNVSLKKKNKEEDDEAFMNKEFSFKLKAMNSQTLLPLPDNERERIKEE
jgi:hypothetical protein